MTPKEEEGLIWEYLADEVTRLAYSGTLFYGPEPSRHIESFSFLICVAESLAATARLRRGEELTHAERGMALNGSDPATSFLRLLNRNRAIGSARTARKTAAARKLLRERLEQIQQDARGTIPRGGPPETGAESDSMSAYGSPGSTSMPPPLTLSPEALWARGGFSTCP